MSSGNKIMLKFATNGTETAKGFHFVYQGNVTFSAIVPELTTLTAFVCFRGKVKVL